MQSVAGGPANQIQAEQSDSLFDIFVNAVHKFTNETLPRISHRLSTFLESAYPTGDQLRDCEIILQYLLIQKKFIFPVDINLTSPATRVMFNQSDEIRQQICLKMWLRCQNGVYDTDDLRKQALFLLEGLAFNRRFAGGIYYGIMPVLSDKRDKMKCGPLVANPTLANLTITRPYALVMKRLKEECRLDQRLQQEMFGSTDGMEFLARQVAAMHHQLNRSLPEFGTPERIAAKFEFNNEQFHRALDERRACCHVIAESAFGKADMELIELASNLLWQVSKAHQHDFRKRRRDGHIRRCHGDLKATNLWICPAENESQAQERLVALDCVDFNPEFCNIDTLSDVAMLAVDLEMRFEKVIKNCDEHSGQQLVRHFLQSYLKAAGESETVWPLLECYMTEKAMVCAYMSILYDGLPTLGEKYLKVVLAHVRELEKYLPRQVVKRITRPLQPVPQEVTPVPLEFPLVDKEVTRSPQFIAG